VVVPNNMEETTTASTWVCVTGERSSLHLGTSEEGGRRRRDDLNHINAVVGLNDSRDPNKEFRSDLTFDLYFFPDGVVCCVLCVVCVWSGVVWRERSVARRERLQKITGLSFERLK
jgi:hypothetical protein